MDSRGDFFLKDGFFVSVHWIYTAWLSLGDGLSIFLGPRILRGMNNE